MKTICLKGTWKAEVHDLQFDFEVPGDLLSALIDTGHVPHPYWGKRELDIQWIGQADWKAWTEFSLTREDLLLGRLEIEGLDTAAEVYLNGNLLGSSKNMFARLSFLVGKELQEGQNNLEVRFFSPEKTALREAEALPYPVPCSPFADWTNPHRNLLRKVQCHWGWDWGPVIMTSGIYGDVRLHLYRDRIEYLYTTQRSLDNNCWELHINIEYYAEVSGKISLHYQLYPLPLLESGMPATPQPRIDKRRETRKFTVTAGKNTLEHIMIINDPQLWWPRGYGKQGLYKLEVSNKQLHTSKRIGFRTIRVVCEDDDAGRCMRLQVNGRDIYAKGANWIPVDALPSAQQEEVYRRLLLDAAAANMNTIRLWGGGQYEKNIFYELCDELGLLIWHDMMFACALYPANEEFLAEVKKEVSYQVKRLMSHPSIALWCGNNEDLGALTWYEESRRNRDRYLVDYDRLNEGVIGRLVRSIDSERPWWPSSPSAGPGDYSDCWHDDSKGDMHYWSVWHEGLPLESYYDVTPRFCSEFGFQSFPSLRTVRSFAPESEWNISSPVMLHHQRNDRGNNIILSTMVNYFRLARNFEETLYLSQVQQALAIQTAVEYWRSKRPVNMGALFWQLNDNWPATSWSSLEYGGRWKVLHYSAARFFSPIWLALYVKNGMVQVHGLNDHAEIVRGHLLLRLVHFSGRILRSFSVEHADVEGDSASLLWELSLDELAGCEYSSKKLEEDIHVTRTFLHTTWECINGERIENSLFLAKPRDCYLEQADIRIIPGNRDGSFILSTNRPIFYVFLECDDDGHFSDGGFTLLPREAREICFIPNKTQNPDKRAPSIKEISIKHLRGCYI